MVASAMVPTREASAAASAEAAELLLEAATDVEGEAAPAQTRKGPLAALGSPARSLAKPFGVALVVAAVAAVALHSSRAHSAAHINRAVFMSAIGEMIAAAPATAAAQMGGVAPVPSPGSGAAPVDGAAMAPSQLGGAGQLDGAALAPSPGSSEAGNGPAVPAPGQLSGEAPADSASTQALGTAASDAVADLTDMKSGVKKQAGLLANMAGNLGATAEHTVEVASTEAQASLQPAAADAEKQAEAAAQTVEAAAMEAQVSLQPAAADAENQAEAAAQTVEAAATEAQASLQPIAADATKQAEAAAQTVEAAAMEAQASLQPIAADAAKQAEAAAQTVETAGTEAQASLHLAAADAAAQAQAAAQNIGDELGDGDDQGEAEEDNVPEAVDNGEEGAQAECSEYMASQGCGWTSDWNCPGQPAGKKDAAADDGSDGYGCCCTLGFWKE